MAENMKKFDLWKAIIEVRYPTTATIFDNRGKIANNRQHQNDLTEWLITDNKVVVHNSSKTKVLIAGPTSVVVVEELPRNFKAFSVEALEHVREILNTLDVNKSTRLGLRMFYIAERKGFVGLVKKIGRRLYQLNDDEWDIFGGLPEDIGFPLTLKIDEDKANYKFGPMEKKQYRRDNIFESEESFNKLPDVSLLIDFDLFRLNPSGRPLNDLVKDFMENGGKRIEDHVRKFEQHFGEL